MLQHALRARHPKAQEAEALIACNILKMLMSCMAVLPKSIEVIFLPSKFEQYGPPAIFASRSSLRFDCGWFSFKRGLQVVRVRRRHASRKRLERGCPAPAPSCNRRATEPGESRELAGAGGRSDRGTRRRKGPPQVAPLFPDFAFLGRARGEGARQAGPVRRGDWCKARRQVRTRMRAPW